MAVAYTIAAHPTMYRGCRFRSRLEATWAAFFDQLGWSWEYEPFDLHGWVPDFLIGGNTLVEVKPIRGGDADVAEKMMLSAPPDYNLMICGAGPIIEYGMLASIWSSCNCNISRCNWSARAIIKINEQYDVAFWHGNNVRGFFTCVNVTGAVLDEWMGREVKLLWHKAKNLTQWQPQ